MNKIDAKFLSHLLYVDVLLRDEVLLSSSSEWMMDRESRDIYNAINTIHGNGKALSPTALLVYGIKESLVDALHVDETDFVDIHDLLNIIRSRYARNSIENYIGNVQYALHNDANYSIEDFQISVDELLRKQIVGSNNDPILIGDIIQGHRDTIIYETHHGGCKDGIIPHIHGLEDMVGTFRPGTVAVIAGRPSAGKSLLALELSSYNILEHGKCGAMFSLEMSRETICDRLISRYCDIDLLQITKRFLTPQDIKKMYKPEMCNACKSTNVVIERINYETGESVLRCLDCKSNDILTTIGRINNMSLVVEDSGGISIQQIEHKTRYLKRKYPSLSFIVIDYIQLMDLDNDNKNDALDNISRRLHNLAKDLNIAIIIVSQMNRKVDERPGRRPMLSDLRDSGGIEQNADYVLFVHREYVYSKKEEDQFHGELILAKQRNGPIGTINISVDLSRQKFYDVKSM